MTTAWTSGLHNWRASHILVGIKTFIFLSPSNMTVDYTCFFQVLLQNMLSQWMLFQQQRVYCGRARGSGFSPWGPDSKAADCCCQPQNSFKVYPPPFTAQAVHSHAPLNPTSTMLSLPHHFSTVRGSLAQSRLTDEVQDGCIWAGPQHCPLFRYCSSSLTRQWLGSASTPVLGIGSNSPSPTDVTAFTLGLLDVQKMCIIFLADTAEAGNTLNMYLAPHNTRAMVVCSTLRYACPLLIQNCSTLSVHITAQPLQGTLCLLLHLHTSQRFDFWSMNGVSRNWLLCWYASERIMPSFSLLFIVYQRCLISDKQKRWILGNLAIIKSRMSRMALQYVQRCV